MRKRCKIFKNLCVFFRVVRPLNLRRQNLKLLKIKQEKMTDVPAWASLTSKDAKVKSFFQQLQTWYERYTQVFENAKFFGDLTIEY